MRLMNVSLFDAQKDEDFWILWRAIAKDVINKVFKCERININKNKDMTGSGYKCE